MGACGSRVDTLSCDDSFCSSDRSQRRERSQRNERRASAKIQGQMSLNLPLPRVDQNTVATQTATFTITGAKSKVNVATQTADLADGFTILPGDKLIPKGSFTIGKTPRRLDTPKNLIETPAKHTTTIRTRPRYLSDDAAMLSYLRARHRYNQLVNDAYNVDVNLKPRDILTMMREIRTRH